MSVGFQRNVMGGQSVKRTTALTEISIRRGKKGGDSGTNLGEAVKEHQGNAEVVHWKNVRILPTCSFGRRHRERKSQGSEGGKGPRTLKKRSQRKTPLPR